MMKSNTMRVAFLLSIALLTSACAGSSNSQPVANSQSAERNEFTEREDFGRYFREEGVTGTLLIYDLRTDRFLVHDAERARKGSIPASTFKIANSMIALETGSMADTSTVLEWDGKDRGVEVWNRDHSMTTAFRNSVVWYYQEAARRTGKNRMQSYVSRMDYGNADLSGAAIDSFWLEGNLRISAAEQIGLLRRLYRNELPFSEETLDKVKGIMVEERGQTESGERYLLRSKTGWAQEIGWYVGYVVSDGRPYFFALNMDMPKIEQAPIRKRIVRAALDDLDVI